MTEYPDRDEEAITDLFAGKLGTVCDLASKNGEVERAFAKDLSREFPGESKSGIPRFSRGFVASVHFHPRHVEGKTGGDLGIVIASPDVRLTSTPGNGFYARSEHSRGLLCQAKIFGRASTWGKLTERQENKLSSKLNYVALMLYRYSDNMGARRNLDQIRWQLACGASIDAMQGWFADDEFPTLLDSSSLLNLLTKNKIGTDDPKILSEIICPPVRRSLQISLEWKGDADKRRPHLLEGRLAKKEQSRALNLKAIR